MITQYYSSDWAMEYRVTIPATRAHENLNEIFEWAKENNLGSITRESLEWIHSVGSFIAGVPTRELALEFVLRFG